MRGFSFGRFTVELTFVFLLLCGAVPALAAGELDPAFNPAAFGFSNGTINVVKKQPDGKFLIGGTFTEANGQGTTAVARLNADGTVDTSFSSPDFGNGVGLGGAIFAIGVQSNGKIVVGGELNGVNNVNDKKLYRLNADGSLDTTFLAPSFDFFQQATVYDIEIQPDDKIVAGGNFQINSGSTALNLARFNADGTLDGGFNNIGSMAVYTIALQGDGKIVVGGNSMMRLNSNGTGDASFTSPTLTSSIIYDLTIQPDGKFLIAGLFSTVNGFNAGNIARINADGSVDLTFNLNNPGANGRIYDVQFDASGKILITGLFTAYNGTTRQRVARLNADGTLDTTFQNNPNFTFFFADDSEVMADGRILTGGATQPGTVQPLAILSSVGAVDTTVSYAIGTTGKVGKVAVQPDGKVLVGGQFTAIGGVRRNSLARLNADGTVDTTFVPYFNAFPTQQTVNAIALQPDGKIIVGFSHGETLVRLTTTGALDQSFPTVSASSVIYDLAIQSNGQILAAGGIVFASSQNYIARFNSDGSRDTAFAPAGSQPNQIVNKIVIQPDTKILIGGAFTQVGSTGRGRVARLNFDGSLDTVFNPPGGANGDVSDMELQADGRIVVAGAFTGLNGSLNQARVGRFNADGTLDTTFAQTVGGPVYALKMQPDGKFLIGGTFSQIGGTGRTNLARLNANGALDPTFNAAPSNTVWDIQQQTDDKVLIGGEFTKVNGTSRLRVARLLNVTVPPRHYFDYDGDGRADVSVFRAAENKWYILRSSDFGVTQTVFAIPNDVPVPADYDGDGKTDIAIWRPSNGAWWYLSSITGAQINVNFGQTGDIPRPSDVDGDGRTDFVVFRPSTSVWYRMTGTGATSIIAFGSAGDKPVIGDFDGDGKADPAIFRPSTGDWWYASSITGQFLAVHWGATNDIPAPADYDGDGKTDFAIFRPSDGGWFIANSSSGSVVTTSFGTSGDKPVPADYDGDGKADIAVFRPASGVWYLLQTTAGFGALQWGVAADTPTENAFLQ
ncbi:MAG: VCBS repeat-containing protein [Acidobacteria bacterium]|nr:VCBS repeat-containing protein [Acidobacteriota bacterium]